jgi:regulator of RNase E activity RraA
VTGPLGRLAALDTCAVSDALDSLGLHGAALGLHRLTGKHCIAGEAITLDLVEADGTAGSRHLGTAAVDASGPGTIIVVAHHGRTDVAGWGGLLCAGAVTRKVEGVVVDGAIRDLDEAREFGLPVFATGSVPVTARTRVVEREWNIPVEIAGVTVCPNDYVLADGSGVVFVARQHIDEVLAIAESNAEMESQMLKRIQRGEEMATVMSSKYESILARKAFP